MISLMPLPYSAAALEPHISSETIETHHGKHHAGYVKKTNAAIAGTPLADAALEAIIQHAADSKDQKLFNQAAQVWNHGFYWHSLSAKPGKPDDALSAAIARDHGSLDALLKDLAEQATTHFGSGWVWLALREGALVIEQTHDAATMATGPDVPLLVIDVWEHAYYLDRRNLRDAYVKAVTEKLLDGILRTAILPVAPSGPTRPDPRAAGTAALRTGSPAGSAARSGLAPPRR